MAHHRTGSADAFVADTWAEHHEEVYAFLVGVTRNPAVAEDLLSEAYLRLTREAREGRYPEQPRAWLYRVGGNLATSRGRHLGAARRWFERTVAREPEPRLADPPEDGLIHAETTAELLAALDAVGPDARRALLLAAEGFSGPEIARLIGRSEAATRTLLCRARVRVRARLGERETVR